MDEGQKWCKKGRQGGTRKKEGKGEEGEGGEERRRGEERREGKGEGDIRDRLGIVRIVISKIDLHLDGAKTNGLLQGTGVISGEEGEEEGGRREEGEEGRGGGREEGKGIRDRLGIVRIIISKIDLHLDGSETNGLLQGTRVISVHDGSDALEVGQVEMEGIALRRVRGKGGRRKGRTREDEGGNGEDGGSGKRGENKNG
jgi:hypothetical protein